MKASRVVSTVIIISFISTAQAPAVLAAPTKSSRQPANPPTRQLAAADSVIERTLAASNGERISIDLRPGGQRSAISE